MQKRKCKIFLALKILNAFLWDDLNYYKDFFIIITNNGENRIIYLSRRNQRSSFFR